MKLLEIQAIGWPKSFILDAFYPIEQAIPVLREVTEDLQSLLDEMPPLLRNKTSLKNHPHYQAQYPEVFLCEAFDCQLHPLSREELEGIQYILSYMPDRMYDIVQRRYSQLRTYMQIALEFGISWQRVDHILRNARALLREPDNRRILAIGCDGYLREAEKLKACKRNEYEASINSLGLSNRTCLVLFGYDISEIRELTETSLRDLLAMQGMGKKSILEIQNALTRRGLSLKL